MKRIISALLVAATVPVVLTGCMGGAMVKKDSIAETGRIAIVSVVMPRIADTAKESNRAALQAFVERALVRVQADLKTVRDWTVVDPAGYKGGPAVMSFGAVSDEEIAALFPSGEERKTARGLIARELSQWKRYFIGAKALPIVPRSALVRDKGEKSALAMIPSVMQKHAARLCSALNVDAVAFVHVLASITHPRPKTFIVSGNRTDGALHAAQTMVIVDKTGRIIVDMGWPALDEGARSRDLLPLYAGSGQDAVKQENIDLGDPKNKIVQAFSSLIDETASDMIEQPQKGCSQIGTGCLARRGTRGSQAKRVHDEKTELVALITLLFVMAVPPGPSPARSSSPVRQPFRCVFLNRRRPPSRKRPERSSR